MRATEASLTRGKRTAQVLAQKRLRVRLTSGTAFSRRPPEAVEVLAVGGKALAVEGSQQQTKGGEIDVKKTA